MFAFRPLDPTHGPSGIMLAKAEWIPAKRPPTELLFLCNRGDKIIESYYVHPGTGDIFRCTHTAPYQEFVGTWMQVARA